MYNDAYNELFQNVKRKIVIIINCLSSIQFIGKCVNYNPVAQCDPVYTIDVFYCIFYCVFYRFVI